MDIEFIKQEFLTITEHNDWDKLHTPKNLSTAVSIHAALIQKHFQWLEDQESNNMVRGPEQNEELASEVANVLIYLVALCDKVGIQLESAVNDKLAWNRQRFLHGKN
jgi:dCTP diphosphatase